MANGHGGARPGGGRKLGSTTKRTREIAEQAFKDGVTPLEMMLKAARTHYDAGRYDQAATFARDAAPYMHPRLAAIEHAGKDGGPIETKAYTDEERERALMVILAKAQARLAQK